MPSVMYILQEGMGSPRSTAFANPFRWIPIPSLSQRSSPNHRGHMSSNTLKLLGFAPALIVSCGCSARMVNLSRVTAIPSVADFSVIRASILVTCEDPFSTVHEDVAKKLTEDQVFLVASAPSTKGTVSNVNARLFVEAKIVENSHHGKELVGAVARGFLLGIADGVFMNRYDYSVAITAVLHRGQHRIGTYKATSRFRSEVPENDPSRSRDSETRLRAWKHVLDLLAWKMKADRARIVQELGVRN